MSKKDRNEKLVSWYRKKKNTYRIMPKSVLVFKHMLTHRYITDIAYKKLCRGDNSTSTSLTSMIQQLRNIGATITSVKYRQGGKMHYFLKDKTELANMLNINIDALKQSLENFDGKSAQPILYSKATKFELVDDSLRQSSLEIPVYYWEDDKENVHVDRELMCKEFNEKLDELEQEFDDAWREKQEDYANDNR